MTRQRNARLTTPRRMFLYTPVSCSARTWMPVSSSTSRATPSAGVLEVVRIAYTADDMPVETVINVFPSQQWRLTYEWLSD